jgi:copper oxidase (laccase) domain-containing protein
MESHLLFEKKIIGGTFKAYSARPTFEILTVKQIHSDLVRCEKEAGLEGDGLIGSSHSPIAVLTADCIPLVLVGEKSHAVIHAGWKGLKNRILSNPLIKEMNPNYAFIGPHIRIDQYEVQADFKLNFPQSTSFKEIDNKIYFDLTKEVTGQLQNIYPQITIEDCGICTFKNEQFSSFRRNKTPHRNWNIYLPEGHLA